MKKYIEIADDISNILGWIVISIVLFANISNWVTFAYGYFTFSSLIDTIKSRMENRIVSSNIYAVLFSFFLIIFVIRCFGYA